MRRPAHRARARSTILALALVAGACSGPPAPTITAQATGSTASPSGTDAAAQPSATSDPRAACVRSLARTMTRAERIGQLFMVGLDSGASRSAIDAEVTAYHVGGVILLGGWSRSGAVRAATDHLNALTRGPRLFLAADQEGGAVQQLTGAGFSTIPAAREQAAVAGGLRRRAADWGSELAAVGINVNLAPVADTVPAAIGTANGPIGQFGRQYGSTPSAVTPPMLAFLQGMHDAGIMTSVKHFPGIGRIRGNTDTSADGITDPVTTTRDPHLEPFAAGIDGGTDFVMVSSARYPKLSAEQALFSSAIVTDLLREQLGFAGVVITDDVGAADALQAVPIADRALRFLAAGGDMILTARSADIAIMTAAVAQRVTRDPDFAVQVDAALERILTLKASRGLVACD
ncbi:MAG TPA: glycoside hydrolase family 3 N-terminal domain-containing protein [Tetrasphaera sp.]|nr:glycoside hydrolase family 3 N-terminal domain-containing protein [Tetrasphaera sp.]